MSRTIHTHGDDTRARVLKAAARLFAERGFNHVSVRDICKEARTNVAAVNYHFGDKLGLYRELISTVAEGMNEAKNSAFDVGEGKTPAEQLCAYIRRFMRQLLSGDLRAESWMDVLIAREMAEPTAALDLMIEKGIKPAGERLNRLVSGVMALPAEDYRVLLAASSIQALCLWYRSTRTVAERLVPGLQYTPEVVDGIADFVAAFSLAGMAAVREGKPAQRPSPDPNAA